MNKIIVSFTCLVLTLSLQANVLNDPGFEDAALGPLTDGDDLGQWRSYGNMPVVDTEVRSGDQSLLLGNFPQPYSDGNLRQRYTVSNEPPVWIMSAWVYYDSTEGDNDPATDFFIFNLQTSAGNFDNTIHASNINDQAWTFLSFTNNVDVSAAWVKFYIAKIWNAGGTNGLFYFDDTVLAPVPEPFSFGAIALSGALFLLRRK
jgi:hypothetical protein